MTAAGREAEREALELELLLEALFRYHGYDFRGYARASLKRRLWGVAQAEGTATLSGLLEKLLHDPGCLDRLVVALTVNVTSLFRDPEFFLAFRQKVVPLLRTYPFARIWHAGCSTGEEVYSMAILLHEEEILGRCRIYATDVNDAILRQAREGIFPLQQLGEYERNYTLAGGRKPLSDYYTRAYGHAIFSAALKENLLFSPHNLAMDGSFNEFQVILCRNVMIYFSRALQQRVHGLLYDSLVPFGVLGLGNRESLHFSAHEGDYAPVEPGARLYRRIH